MNRLRNSPRNLLLAAAILVISCHEAIALQPLSNIENTDHNGTDWVIDESTVIAGLHRGIGEFKINPGVTVTVIPSTVTASPWTNGRFGSIQIYASSIKIDGMLNANGAGFGEYGPCDGSPWNGLG